MAEFIASDHRALRTCLLYEYLQGRSAAEAHRNISAVIGPQVISDFTARNWFRRFKEGDYDISDKPRCGRPTSVNDDQLLAAIEANPRQSVRELEVTLGDSKSTIHRHLHQLGKVKKFGDVVPHDLTEDNKNARCDAALYLLTRHRTMDWLSYVVTGDEKWCLCVNHTRKRQWVDIDKKAEPDLKGELHPKKVMLSIWWDRKGVIYWELLPDNTTVTAEVYCCQLENMVAEFKRVRPGHDKILLLHDNARPHTAKSTRLKLQSLGIEVLPHPPYSPDLAPTDYHLFRALANCLHDKKFDDRRDLEIYLRSFFDSQPPSFYARGIDLLPKRWQLVIDHDGIYIDEDEL